MTAPVPWKRLLIEGAVIVASILLAFGIDAAWAARGEAAQERALLQGLAEDFEAAAGGLERSRASHQSKREAAERLLSWAESRNAEEVPAESVDVAIRWLLARVTFDPPMGTVGSLLGSGRLDILSDADLARELTGWSATWGNLREQEDQAARYLFDNLLPFLTARINLKDTEITPEFAARLQWPGKRESTNANLLLADSEFQSMVFVAWSIEQVVFMTMEPVEAAIARISRLVDEELGE